MQKNYREKHLKSYAAKSINSMGRIYQEKENYIRSPYQRDRDRIIHSSSFNPKALANVLAICETSIECVSLVL